MSSVLAQSQVSLSCVPSKYKEREKWANLEEHQAVFFFPELIGENLGGKISPSR